MRGTSAEIHPIERDKSHSESSDGAAAPGFNSVYSREIGHFIQAADVSRTPTRNEESMAAGVLRLEEKAGGHPQNESRPDIHDSAMAEHDDSPAPVMPSPFC